MMFPWCSHEIPFWLVVSNILYFPFHIYGMSSFPLTFIFFKMVIAPPTSLISPLNFDYFHDLPMVMATWSPSGQEWGNGIVELGKYGRKVLDQRRANRGESLLKAMVTWGSSVETLHICRCQHYIYYIYIHIFGYVHIMSIYHVHITI
jgi:hypothetical protein